MKKTKFSEYIKSFDFKTLFNELGWDNFNNNLPIAINEDAFLLSGIVEKKGFVILHCPSIPNGRIPLSNIRKHIEAKVSKHYFEHLIIYTDQNQSHQIWQIAIKEENKPKQVREISWYSHQDTEILFQRLKNLLFTLDEEEQITIVDVKQRVSENFAKNTESVTKKFYTEFKKQHTVFLDFINGIDDHIANKENTNKQWYASLMLNRLMFCYFIQKKGFLNQDIHYLGNKLNESKLHTGKDNFYSFYRSFLLELFHDGLGKPEKHRHEHSIGLGKIPYLNGGLFDVHELEKQFEEINISDDAFNSLFNFFDQWNWHLDNSSEATGRDINPDVIGYIFEKYINDRASMGAFYTKEDITDYIGKNTIIPYLFDETERNYHQGFKQESELWSRLKQSGVTYIYAAVKKGVPEGDLFDDMPEEVKAGFQPDFEKKVVKENNLPHLWETRKVWNAKAPKSIALSTEIYRELIERRKRYAEIKSKIENGEINHINDFITYNLNIKQFAQDFIENTNDAVFISHFYKSIKKITILDPTCGSGAFLFAALNILEPLYEACIMRMEQFVTEEKGKHLFFEETLEDINAEQHPNLQYYIFKNIILNNLYGVDIMKEAVEIAKLRLFLKLVATVDVNPRKENFGLEPLPDIDFNIRAGNTLIGFATEKELLRAVQVDQHGQYRTGYEEILENFKEDCKLVSKAYNSFKDAQLLNELESDSFKAAKADLHKRLDKLNHKLNLYLANNFGITDAEDKQKGKFNRWLATHQPFHWFAEFYGIVSGSDGFDCVIGNPPYVTFPNKSVNYTLQNLKTIKSSNLFSFCMERSECLINPSGRFSFIILMASITTKRMSVLRKFMIDNYKSNWIINLAGDWHPGRLFDGVRSQFSVWSSTKYGEKGIYTTDYIRWYNEERETIFQNLKFASNKQNDIERALYKVGSEHENSILDKIGSNKRSILSYKSNSSTKNKFEYRNAGIAYYQIAIDFKQHFKVNGIESRSSTLFSFYTNDSSEKIAILSLLNSNIFSLFYFLNSDCYHLTSGDFSEFKIDVDQLSSSALNSLQLYINDYMNSLKTNSIIKTTNYRSKGEVVYQEFYPKFSKTSMNRIDNKLAQHYSFSEEELDFIINYDIKYRMGKALFGEENGVDED
jgi:hypothetical protein